MTNNPFCKDGIVNLNLLNSMVEDYYTRYLMPLYPDSDDSMVMMLNDIDEAKPLFREMIQKHGCEEEFCRNVATAMYENMKKDGDERLYIEVKYKDEIVHFEFPFSPIAKFI